MKLGIKRGQRGFTLVELMVVMAIIAVLAAIVVPAVSGTTEVSNDAQVKNDAGLVQSALGDFYGDQTGAEVFATTTVYILATDAERTVSSLVKNQRAFAGASIPTIAVEDGVASQVTSSRWPELTLADDDTDTTGIDVATYGVEFTYDDDTTVSSVTIKDKNGASITPEVLAASYNAINFTKLYNTTVTDPQTLPLAAYIPSVPASVDEKSGTYHNYLWLVKKTTAAADGGSVESRTVAVFKLSEVEEAETGGLDALKYEQIY